MCPFFPQMAAPAQKLKNVFFKIAIGGKVPAANNGIIEFKLFDEVRIALCLTCHPISSNLT